MTSRLPLAIQFPSSHPNEGRKSRKQTTDIIKDMYVASEHETDLSEFPRPHQSGWKLPDQRWSCQKKILSG